MMANCFNHLAVVCVFMRVVMDGFIDQMARELELLSGAGIDPVDASRGVILIILVCVLNGNMGFSRTKNLVRGSEDL